METNFLNQEENIEDVSTIILNFEQEVLNAVDSLPFDLSRTGMMKTLTTIFHDFDNLEQRLLSILSNSISQSLAILKKEQTNISYQIRNNILSSHNETVSALDHTKESGNYVNIETDIFAWIKANMVVIIIRNSSSRIFLASLFVNGFWKFSTS